MRLTSLDFTELAKPVPPVLSQVAFGILCSLVAILIRMLTDMWLPGAGPFALTIPLVLAVLLLGEDVSWTLPISRTETKILTLAVRPIGAAGMTSAAALPAVATPPASSRAVQPPNRLRNLS